MVFAKAVVALALLPGSLAGNNFQFPSIRVNLSPGQTTAVTSTSSETKVTCQTLLGPIPPIFPVLTKTITQLVPDFFGTTVTSTSTPTQTVTPKPVQITKHLTSIVTSVVQGPPATELSKITTTILSSVLRTVTLPLATTTLTIVDTSTKYTSTSTVQASGGFLGVLQTGLPVVSKQKRDELMALGMAQDEQASREVDERGFIDGILHGIFPGSGGSGSGSSGNPLFGGSNPFLNGLPGLPSPKNLFSITGNLYPLGVNCIANVIAHKIITVVVLASPVQVTLPAQTVTSTCTDTETITSTHIPSTVTSLTTLSTTTTITANTTLPQNTLTATTTTTAVLEQVSSYFAACNQNNLLGPTLPSQFGVVAGDLITDILYDPSKVQLATVAGNTLYDCCTQCITQKGCAFGGFAPEGICYLHLTQDSSCPAQSANIGEYVVSPPPQSQTFGVYNGYCGELAYGGLESNT